MQSSRFIVSPICLRLSGNLMTSLSLNGHKKNNKTDSHGTLRSWRSAINHLQVIKALTFRFRGEETFTRPRCWLKPFPCVLRSFNGNRTSLGRKRPFTIIHYLIDWNPISLSSTTMRIIRFAAKWNRMKESFAFHLSREANGKPIKSSREKWIN